MLTQEARQALDVFTTLVPKRGRIVMPQLQKMRIVPDMLLGGYWQVADGNHFISWQTEVEGKSCGMVDVHTLARVVRHCKDKETDFCAINGDGLLNLESGNFSAKLRADSPGDHPLETLFYKSQNVIVLDGPRFINMIKRVNRCRSKGDGNHILHGIGVEVGKDVLCLAATDGSRLSYENIGKPWCRTKGTKDAEPFEFLMPPEVCKLLTSSAMGKALSAEIKFTFGEVSGHATMEWGKFRMRFRHATGEKFPRYKKLIPDADKAAFRTKLSRKELLDATRAVLPFTNPRTLILRYLFMMDGTAVVDGINRCDDFISVRQPFKHDIDLSEGMTQQLEISFNGNYMVDALAAFPKDQITITTNGPLAPTLLRSEPLDYTHLLMPVQVK